MSNIRNEISFIINRINKLCNKSINVKLIFDIEENMLTPFGYILYERLQNNIIKGICEIVSISPGEILIKKKSKNDSNEPFEHVDVKLYHKYLTNYWKPPYLDYVIIMPCTRVKPYGKSVTHKMMYKYLKDIKEDNLQADVFSISEPMILVPRKYEHLYPLANYDYPPRYLNEAKKNYMAKLLKIILIKLLSHVRYKAFAVLPYHHYKILRKAIELSNNDDIINDKLDLRLYGTKTFRTLRKVYEEIIIDAKSRNIL